MREYIRPGSIEVNGIPLGFTGYWLDDPSYTNPIRTDILIPGIYCYRIVNTVNGCFEDICYEVGVNSVFDWRDCDPDPTTRNDASIQKLSVYPNPTSDIVNLQGVSSDNEITIYSMDGTLVARTKGKNQIDISSFNNGLYLLIVKDNILNVMHQKKIIKL